MARLTEEEIAALLKRFTGREESEDGDVRVSLAFMPRPCRHSVQRCEECQAASKRAEAYYELKAHVEANPDDEASKELLERMCEEEEARERK